jgi:hypothetical protein
MDHKPYESWLVAGEPLLPDQELRLHEHLESCDSCRRLQLAWLDVEGLFEGAGLVQPKPGFSNRFRFRLTDELAREQEKKDLMLTWVFLGTSFGAAFLILLIMSIRFFTSVQNSTQVFISGMTLIAGLMNLTKTIQSAFIPLLEVIIVSVPTLWWLYLVLGASLLTIALAYTTFRFLSTRRVSP